MGLSQPSHPSCNFSASVFLALGYFPLPFFFVLGEYPPSSSSSVSYLARISGSVPIFLSVALVDADKVFFLDPFNEGGLGGMGCLVPLVSFLILEGPGLGDFLIPEGPG